MSESPGIPREQEPYLDRIRHAAVAAGMIQVEVVPPAPREVVADGLRLHCLDWRARPGARPLLFLHGGALTAHTWDLVSLALRPEYACVALDQRGHGDSDWAPDGDYSRRAYVRDIERVVAELGLRRPVLVGHSLGGINAVAYAAEHPGAVAGVVVVDIGPRFRNRGATRIHDFITSDEAYDSVEQIVSRAHAFNPRRDRRMLRASLQHNLRRGPDGLWRWKYDRSQFRPIADLLAEWDVLEGGLARAACPVLIVRGSRSEVFHDDDAERFARAVGHARWVRVEDAGHTVQGDNPSGFVEAVLPFLRELDAASA